MIRTFALALGLALFAALTPAAAQVSLPVPTPDVQVPLPNAGEVVNRTVEGAPLRELRRLRIDELLRTHRRELEPDPRGQPIVRSQILALAMNAEALAQAEALGFSVVRRDALGGDDMLTLRAPRGMSTRRALERLRNLDPSGVYDFDHLHLESGAVSGAILLGQIGAARAPPRIGLIDSGIAREGAQAGAFVARRAFSGAGDRVSDHGEIVAGRLMIGAPGARLYGADIYGGAADGGSSSALTRALTWLADENVPVINVSLVGPRNRIVEAIVGRLVARGHAIVAAVGNDGPAAAPLYPAAYEGVIGVSAVDGRGRALMEAGRGAHVDFAANGLVNARVRGTSYAAPIVAGVLAQRYNVLDPAALENALSALRAQARDLGAPGRDPIYGDGLIEAP